MNGSVYGTGTNAALSLMPGSNPADVPPYLVDLLNHPERVGYGGIVTGGVQNILSTTLPIARRGRSS